MRKTIARIVAVVSAAALLGAAAGPAGADVSNATEYNVNPTAANGFFHGWRCETPPALGVMGVSGAWGAYVDGCTTNPVVCWPGNPPSGYVYGPCALRIETHFQSEIGYGFQVTQNARLWFTDHYSGAVTWRDYSCVGVDSCTITASVPEALRRGSTVTAQCNGQNIRNIVLAGGASRFNWAHNSCSVTLREPPRLTYNGTPG